MKNALWETIGKIVTAYIRKGHPAYGIVALALFLGTGLAALALLYAAGAPVVQLLRLSAGL